MKNYQKTKARIEFYLAKPDFNKFASSCDLDESIRGIIHECRTILELQEIVKQLGKCAERKSCSPSLRHQIINAVNLGLNIRYEYLETFINNIKAIKSE